MSVARKLLASLVVCGLAAVAVAAATWSSFSATTANPSNAFSAGTVAISDNDAGAGAGVVYSGTLSAFASTYTNYANGLLDAPGSAQTWNANSAHVYKLTISLPAGAPSAAQGLSSTATFDWEAQNQ